MGAGYIAELNPETHHALTIELPALHPSMVDHFKGDDPVHGKRSRSFGASTDEQTQQSLGLRHMTHEHYVPGFTCELVGHRVRQVGWLEPSRRCVFRKGNAHTPKRLSRLTGAQLATVSDHRWSHASLRGLLGEVFDSGQPI